MSSILILNDFLINKIWEDLSLPRFYSNDLNTDYVLNLKSKFLFLKNVAHPMDRHDITRVSRIFFDLFTKM